MRLLFHQLSLPILVLLVFASEAGAVDIIVQNGTVKTTTVTGDPASSNHILIEEGAQIKTSPDFAYGIRNDGSGSVIENSGYIATQGDVAHGIFNQGSGSVIQNSE